MIVQNLSFVAKAEVGRRCMNVMFFIASDIRITKVIFSNSPVRPQTQMMGAF